MAKKLEEGDEERGRYLETLKNGSRFRGYVGFDRHRAEKPIAEYLGLDNDGFLYLIIDHLQSGGRLDRVDETRPEWSCHKFHFDLWPEVAAGMEQKIEKENRLWQTNPIRGLAANALRRPLSRWSRTIKSHSSMMESCIKSRFRKSRFQPAGTVGPNRPISRSADR